MFKNLNANQKTKPFTVEDIASLFVVITTYSRVAGRILQNFL